MNEYKPPLHLIPRAALLEEAKAFDSTKNDRKPWDWLRADVSMVDQARGAMSHISKWLDREDFDPETGAHHLGHARARLAIVLALIDRSLGTDDRMPDVGKPQRERPKFTVSGPAVGVFVAPLPAASSEARCRCVAPEGVDDFDHSR